MEQITQDIKSIKLETNSFEDIRKTTQNKIDELHDSITTFKVETAEMEGKMNNYREHLFSKYQKRLEEIENKEKEVTMPWETVPDRILEVDKRISNLGNVNLAAISELEVLQERFNFLTTQETDLTNAKKQLSEIIARINETATKMFDETFNKVKVYFSDTFMELFEGGKAELKLLDSENILDAGIEIIARPPGKHPQTISLLSGGEKALTATALLFALFKVKPSPFCFIDELDAPLDDNNIARFIKLLKSFSKSTQFIVVTHNKSTLKIADLLYGVSQIEKGVSRIISVKFIDEDLDHLLEEKPVPQGQSKKRKIEIKEEDELLKTDLPRIKSVQLHSPQELNTKLQGETQNPVPEQTETEHESILEKRMTTSIPDQQESITSPLNERIENAEQTQKLVMHAPNE